jgi:transposase-like protein
MKSGRIPFGAGIQVSGYKHQRNQLKKPPDPTDSNALQLTIAANAYLNRLIEQDHRGIMQRYYPILGFGAFPSAQRFCRAFEEVRQSFRPRRKRK